MQQCPHCGVDVDDEPACSNCGQSFDGLSEQPRESSERPTTADTQTEQPGDSDPDTSAEEPGRTIRMSRRTLLGGAGASVAVLGVGGAGWALLRGGGEGRQVIGSYVDAMAANDFSGVPELYHDDASLLQEIDRSNEFDDYEGYLEQRGALETWRDIEPELESTEEFYHITEVTEESLSELELRIDAPRASEIDEFRQVVAFISVAVGALDSEQQNTAQYYDNGTERVPLTCTVVRSGGSWQLWTARATVV